MKEKTFEVSKGKGKSNVVQQFTVKSEEDITILGTFLYFGWTVKEIKRG